MKFVPALLLAACAETTVPSTDSTSPTTDPVPTTVTTSVTADTGTSLTLPEGPGFGGRVVDSNGQPLPDEEVLACTLTSCLVSETNAAGQFFVGLDEVPELRSVKTHEHNDTVPRRAAALVPVECLDADAVWVGDIVAPSLSDGAPWGPVSEDPQTLDAGDGLVVTVNRDDVHLPFGSSFDNVAAGRLPDPFLPAYPGLNETVIAVYALHPFDASVDSPVGFSAPSDLPPGSVVHFRSVGALGEGLSAPALGTADGTRVSTNPGEGLFELTHVVISVPAAR